MPLLHAFSSSVTDGADTTITQPSDWNANHVIHGVGSGSLLYAVSGSLSGALRAGIETKSGTLFLGDLDSAASYPVPPTSASLLISRRRAGMQYPLWLPSDDADQALQFALWSNSQAGWFAMGNSTVSSTVGGTGWIFSGTAAATSVITSNFSGSMRRLEFTSAAAANNGGGIVYPFAQWWRGDAADKGGFFFISRFVLDGANAFQAFVGMSASVTAGGMGFQGEPSVVTLNGFGLGKDSTDQNWQVMTNDGSGACSKINTGVTATLRGAYEVRLYCSASSGVVGAYIKHLQSGSIFDYQITGSDMPANTTLLAPRVCMGTRAGATAVRPAIVSAWISSDN